MTGDEGPVSPEAVSRLAAQLRLPLAPDRAAELAGRVQDTLFYTGELDQLAMSDVVPATVFSPLDS
jgi:hypothetical protein